MATDYQRMIKEIAELRRKVSSLVRVGTVSEVSGDKLRMNLGKGKDGEDVFGPWLNHSNHRGEHRERQAFRKGQTCVMICPDGDPRQAFMQPGGPNENNKGHKKPKHANEQGTGENTYQHGGYYRSGGNDGMDDWIGEDEGPGEDAGEDGGNGLDSGGGGGQGGQQGQGQQKQQSKRKTGGSDGTYVRRMNKEGGHTMRYKTDNRAAVHEKGSKIKATDDAWMVMSKDNKQIIAKSKEDPIINKPWVIASKKDPIPDDDA